MIFVGIDLGLTGALASLGAPRGPELMDLPRAELFGQPVLDVIALRQLMRFVVPAPEAGLVVVEDVRVRSALSGRNTAHSSETKLMRMRGHVEALVLLLGLRLEVVQPQVWKRHFGLLKAEKGASLALAAELHPWAATDLQRVKDHNRAEALLLAHYARGRWA